MVEFCDEYKARAHTSYHSFQKGHIKNPYHPTVFNVGMIGDKYPSRINHIKTKEYNTWIQMLRRCYDEQAANRRQGATYKNVTCAKEWLIYSNFYEWLHSQENFEKWESECGWCLDKDIICKNNKIYSPDKCCLVPTYINNLFLRANNKRNLPIGVSRHNDKYRAIGGENGRSVHLGLYDTVEEAFLAYKKFKENHIQNIAKHEYSQKNISYQCYKAMMNYKVEIDD